MATIQRGESKVLTVTAEGSDLTGDDVRVVLSYDSITIDKYSTDAGDVLAGYGPVQSVSYDGGSGNTTIVVHLEYTKTINYPLKSVDVVLRVESTVAGFDDGFVDISVSSGVFTVVDELAEAEQT